VRVLVTGGAGAIGSHLVEHLLARGDQVSILDSFHDFYPRALKERNLVELSRHKEYAGLFEGDIRDAAFVKHCLEETRAEAVVHLAARAGVRPSLEVPQEYADVNMNGTAIVLKECADAGVGRFLFASSSTVYGEQDRGAFEEDRDTDRQVSPYGATKRAGELFAYTMHRATGMPITCLRFFSVYGPRQRPDLAVAVFAQALLEGRPFSVFGDGSIERDFTYITDILDGITSALDRADGFKIYNLGRGEPASMNRVIELLEREMGVQAERITKPAHPADVPRTWASVERAARELNYAPQVSLEEGIARYVKWLKE
jgi:UDP-glucuronate 4-epimerase